MKKRIALYAGLACLFGLGSMGFVSCGDDDDDGGVVDHNVTFKVNPQTVVSDFVEMEAGQLTTLDPEDNLNVCLYIYNSQGLLVAQDKQQVADYSRRTSKSIALGTGNYTVVAATYVTFDDSDEPNGEFSYWDFTDTNKLATFKVTDRGYIGSKWKILGLTSKKITVDSETYEVNIDVKCAGAVALVRVMNWKKYDDIERFSLRSNKACDYAQFTSGGTLDYSYQSSNNFGFLFFNMEYDPKYNGGYGFTFMFPFNNVRMLFSASSEEGWWELGEQKTMNIEVGHAYLFTYDVENDVNVWSDETRAGFGSLSLEGLKIQVKNDLIYNYDTKTIQIAQ